MKLTMLGAGYVGLVTGACFADFGFRVWVVDTDPAKIEALKAGRMPIFEPGLESLVATNVAAGRLHFTGDTAAAVAGADAVFIAVGTPSRRGDGHADLAYIRQAARDVAAALTGYTVVVMKSTVPVGTGDEVSEILAETVDHAQFSVVSNPEFLREGAAIGDFKHPDRIVIGVNDDRAREVMMRIYRPLSLNKAPVFITDRRTSELIKYASNAFLATKITFINEMADLCEQVGANVQDLATGLGMDRRIGPKFLNAGPGYGGSCFPKDTLALLRTAEDHHTPLRIVEATVAVNDNRKRQMGRRVIAACGGSVKGKVIAVLGLAFKPNTDDMREAPSINIIDTLVDAGATIRAFDPVAHGNARAVLPPAVTFAESPQACLAGADAMVLVTEWDMLRGLTPGEIKALMRTPIVVDLRNVFRRAEMEAHGVIYRDVGRAAGAPPAG